MEFNFQSHIVTDELLEAVFESTHLPQCGIHGISHWLRVEENGLELVYNYDLNPDVVSLFALFHDSHRKVHHMD